MATENAGMIPVSSALAEADPQSLNLLMDASPEDPMFLSNLPRIVEALQAQAVRFALADAAGGAKRPKAPKASDPAMTESTVEGGLDF